MGDELRVRPQQRPADAVPGPGRVHLKAAVGQDVPGRGRSGRGGRVTDFDADLIHPHRPAVLGLEPDEQPGLRLVGQRHRLELQPLPVPSGLDLSAAVAAVRFGDQAQAGAHGGHVALGAHPQAHPVALAGLQGQRLVELRRAVHALHAFDAQRRQPVMGPGAVEAEGGLALAPGVVLPARRHTVGQRQLEARIGQDVLGGDRTGQEQQQSTQTRHGTVLRGRSDSVVPSRRSG